MKARIVRQLTVESLVFAIATIFLPLAARAADSQQMCMNQGGKLVVLKPGSGSAGNAEAFPCPMGSPSSDGQLKSSAGDPGGGTSSDGVSDSSLSRLVQSLSSLQDSHEAAVGVHQADQQRDLELTGDIEASRPAISAYLDQVPSAQLILLFSRLFSEGSAPIPDGYGNYATRLVGSLPLIDPLPQRESYFGCPFDPTAARVPSDEFTCEFRERFNFSTSHYGYHAAQNVYGAVAAGDAAVGIRALSPFPASVQPPVDLSSQDNAIVLDTAGPEHAAITFITIAGGEKGAARADLLFAAADQLLEAMHGSLSYRVGERAPTYAIRLFDEFAPVLKVIHDSSATYSPSAMDYINSNLHVSCTAITDTGVSWSQVPVCLSPQRGW